MTQLQEAIRDKITKYSDACGMCTNTTEECDTCSITCIPVSIRILPLW